MCDMTDYDANKIIDYWTAFLRFIGVSCSGIFSVRFIVGATKYASEYSEHRSTFDVDVTKV